MGNKISREPAVYHIFDEQVLKTFEFDGEMYAVYSLPNDPELICSRVERRDISSVMAKRTTDNVKGIVPKLLLLFNKVSFSFLSYFGIAPLYDVYAVLEPKYEYITAVQGWATPWQKLKNAVGEKAALFLMEDYVMSLSDDKLYEFFFDGYRSVYIMNSWDKVEEKLSVLDVDDAHAFDLLRQSQAWLEETSMIHNRHEVHFNDLKKLSTES